MKTESHSINDVLAKNATSFFYSSFSKGLAEGNKPIELHVEDNIIKVKTWQDVFLKFLKYIEENDHLDFDLILDNQVELFKNEKTIIKWSTLKILLDDKSDLTNRYKTFSGKKWNQVKEISNNELLIHINISASTCINRLSNIMDKFFMEQNYLKIVLK